MSQENVEIVRESSELFNRGEFDRWLEYFDPGVVFEPLRTSMQGPYHGTPGSGSGSPTIGRLSPSSVTT
jgi:hypothetical protein